MPNFESLIGHTYGLPNSTAISLFWGQSSPGFLRRTVEEISPLQVADPENCAFILEH
jgi:hypothetical protein